MRNSGTRGIVNKNQHLPCKDSQSCYKKSIKVFLFSLLIEYWVEIGVLVLLGIAILLFKRLKYHCSIPTRFHFIDEDNSELELNREVSLQLDI